MARRTRTIREMRIEHEAAEARGLIRPESDTPRRHRDPSATPRAKPPEPPAAKLRLVWAVRDLGGRTVATFDYPAKADAEALALALKAKGKGPHHVRSEKVSMNT